jgi:hypothetical protein
MFAWAWWFKSNRINKELNDLLSNRSVAGKFGLDKKNNCVGIRAGQKNVRPKKLVYQSKTKQCGRMPSKNMEGGDRLFSKKQYRYRATRFLV